MDFQIRSDQEQFLTAPSLLKAEIIHMTSKKTT